MAGVPSGHSVGRDMRDSMRIREVVFVHSHPSTYQPCKLRTRYKLGFST